MSLAFIAEPLATTCNIAANGIVLHAMCRDSMTPVPKLALAAQVLANLSWLAFALSHADPYLSMTALASLSLQASSLWLRSRAKTRKVVKTTASTDALIQKIPLQT